MKDTARTNGKSKSKESYAFKGFSTSFGTAIPDIAFDELMPMLSASEWKVLCYIMRRTFGFKKEADSISLSQICSGITKKDGQILDSGTGLSKQTVVASLKVLQERGIVIANRQSSPERGDLANTYTLRFQGASGSKAQTHHEAPVQISGESNRPPVSKILTPPSPKSRHPRVQKLDTQETVLQQTDLQQSIRSIGKNGKKVEKKSPPQQVPTAFASEKRGGGFRSVADILVRRIDADKASQVDVQNTSVGSQKTPSSFDLPSSGPGVAHKSSVQATSTQVAQRHRGPTMQRVTAKIADYITDIAHRHGDRRDNANIAQIGALYVQSGAAESGFIDWLIVTEKEIADWQRYHPKEHIDNYMAYFFSTLRNRLGLAAS